MKKLLSAFMALTIVFVFVFFAVGSGRKKEVEIATLETITQREDFYFPEDMWIEIGESFYSGNVKVTYLDCGTSVIHEPAEGKEIIGIEISVENSYSEKFIVEPYDFVCYIGNDEIPVYSFTDYNVSSIEIGIGQTEVIKIYFEVPEDAKNVTPALNPNASGGNQAYFVLD